MADITIQIGSPTIVAPAKFKTRYRELPNGAYTSNVDRTNTPFTLTGLSTGLYELEAIYVNPQGVECYTIVKTFSAHNEYECISFTAEIVEDGSLFYLEINFTAPSQMSPVAPDPPCGWEIEYTQNGTTTTVPYAVLPASGQIRIPVSNNSLTIIIRAMLCGSNYKNCYVDDIARINPNPCIPISNKTYLIREVFNTLLGKCEYYLDISFTQSNPISNPIQLTYAQQGGLVSDFFSGLIPVPSGNTPTITKKLNPVFMENQECTQYDITVIDVCGNGWVYNYPYCRTTCFHATP